MCVLICFNLVVVYALFPSSLLFREVVHAFFFFWGVVHAFLSFFSFLGGGACFFFFKTIILS